MDAHHDLADSRLFQGLELEQLAALYRISDVAEFEAGERIFSQGEIGKTLYVIVEGGVRISITTPAQGEEALVILGPGDSFGEMAVIDSQPRERSATAVAHRHCCLLTIAQNDLHTLFDQDRRLGFIVVQNVLRYLSDQMRRTNEKILFLASAGLFS